MGNKHTSGDSSTSLRTEADTTPRYGTAYENDFPPGTTMSTSTITPLQIGNTDESASSVKATGSARNKNNTNASTPQSLTAQSIKNIRGLLDDVRKHSAGKPVSVAIIGPPFSGVKHFIQLINRELLIPCVMRKPWCSVRQELQHENKLYHWAGIITVLSERQRQYYDLIKLRQEQGDDELSFLHGSFLLDGVAMVEAAKRSNFLSTDSADLLRGQTNTIFWEKEKELCPANSTLYIYLQPKDQTYEAKLQKKFPADPRLVQFYKNIKSELDKLFLHTIFPSGAYTRLIHVEEDYKASRNSSILVIERIALELYDYASRSKETGWCREGPALATKNEERKLPSMGQLQRNSQKIRIVPSIQHTQEEKKEVLHQRFSRNTGSLDLSRKPPGHASLPPSFLSRTTSEQLVVIKPTQF